MQPWANTNLPCFKFKIGNPLVPSSNVNLPLLSLLQIGNIYQWEQKPTPRENLRGLPSKSLKQESKRSNNPAISSEWFLKWLKFFIHLPFMSATKTTYKIVANIVLFFVFFCSSCFFRSKFLFLMFIKQHCIFYNIHQKVNKKN